jgi:hypothetical protein
MPFKEGESGNPKGKPKGAKNKIGKDLRERLVNFLSEEFVTIQTDFKNLKPKERVRLYCDLLQYGLPKLQSVTLEAQLERLTDEQIDDLFNRLKATANEQ